MKPNSIITRIIFGLFTVLVLRELPLALAEVSEDGDHSIPKWSIKTATETCTLIEMDATIQHPVFKEVKSRIPASADVVEGALVPACEEEVQTITLSWSDDGYEWEISLRFEATEDSYALTNFSGDVVSGDGLSRSWSYQEYSYPSAPSKNSIQCNTLILLGGRFEDVTWQPFAQNTDGDFGPGHQCEILATSGGVKFLFFIILALTVVIALVISLFNNPRRK